VSRYQKGKTNLNFTEARDIEWTMLKDKYFFLIKYTETILSNSIQKQLWFETSKMIIAV